MSLPSFCVAADAVPNELLLQEFRHGRSGMVGETVEEIKEASVKTC